MAMIQKITPCLWFDGNGEEAVNFYSSIFADFHTLRVMRYAPDNHNPEGKVLTILFELAGQQFIALNGGPEFPFTEAISLMVSCDSQAEIDHYWDALLVGGTPQQCGWLKDKYGLSWQIVPQTLQDMLQDNTSERANRVMTAMLGMVKLDLPALQQAYDG